MLSSSLIEIVKDAVLECATLLKNISGSIASSTKPHWTEASDPGYGGIVTKWDSFAQDFIAGRIKSHHPQVTILAEEDTGFFNDNAISKEITIVIDPIDGTEWFVSGDYEFSILVTILVGGKPEWTIGAFPKRDIYFIGNSTTIQELPSGQEIILNKKGLYSKQATKQLTGHYRLARPPHRQAYEKILSHGFKIDVNGDGFGTNLSAVEKILKGQATVFIASKMSIIDGFATGHLITSAGGVIRFFDVNSSIDQWVEAPSWSYYDFGADVGRRTRFIAANSEETIAHLLNILN